MMHYVLPFFNHINLYFEVKNKDISIKK